MNAFSLKVCASILCCAGCVTAASNKPVRTEPGAGVKTPGVLIPFSKLEPEARITVRDRPKLLLFSKSVYVAGAESIETLSLESNRASGASTALKQPCGGMVSAFGSVWVPLCGDRAIARVESKDLTVKAKIGTGLGQYSAGAVAATPDSVWALADDKTTLVRIDPDTNLAVAEIRLPAKCQSLTFGETALWVACPVENKVLRINPVTNLVEKRIETGTVPTALAVGQGSVWALCSKEGKVDRIDPKTNKVAKTIDLAVPHAKGSMVFSDGFLWASIEGFPLVRVDPDSEKVVQQFYGPGGGSIEAGAGALWVIAAEGNSVMRIDPKRVRLTLAD